MSEFEKEVAKIEKYNQPLLTQVASYQKTPLNKYKITMICTA
jgi:hypothetical protein